MSRKVLFIIPPHTEMGEYAKKMRKSTGTVPFGILSLITYVREYSKVNLEFKILDFNISTYSELSLEEMYKDIEDVVKQFNPDITGIAAAYNFLYKYIGPIAKSVKNAKSDTIVVAGGACTTAYYDLLLEGREEIDAICYSEGEIPFLELTNSSDMKKLLNEHKSWITKEKLINGVKPQMSYVENLDDIPPIDFGLVNLELYGIYRHSFRPNRQDKERCLPIHTTRGCPFNCVFCIAASLAGKKVRKMSAKRVIQDVKLMIERYNVNVLSIEDDQFLIDRERAKEILKGLSELNVAVRAESGLTISFIDDEMAYLLKQSGMEVIHLAVESGSEYILKEIIDKPIKKEDIEVAVKSCRKYGVMVHSFLVIGFPGEKEEHRQQTIDLINKVGFDWNYITCATPARGSRLYDICKDKGYIDEATFNENAYYTSIINTEDFTAEYITKRAYLLNLDLNFVNNYRMKIKHYEMAKKYFNNIAEKYPHHAFAHYFLAQAYEGLNEDAKTIENHREKFHEIIANDNEWNEYAKHFQLI